MMKRYLLHFMVSGGFFSPIRHLHRGKAVVLTYHRFGDDGALPPGPATSVAAFTRHLDYLSRHYEIVPLSRLLKFRRERETYPPGLAAITIDDGYADTFTHAFPVLRRFGFPATVFVATRFVDGDIWLWPDRLRYALTHSRRNECLVALEGVTHKFPLDDRSSRLQAADRINVLLKVLPDEVKTLTIERTIASLGLEEPVKPPPEFRPLTWDQVSRMADEGMEFGSHSLSHPILTRLSDEALRVEIGDSRRRLGEMLAAPLDAFCYPNGSYDARVRAEVERAGYGAAFSTDAGLDDPKTDALTIKRIVAESNFDRFVQAVTGGEALRTTLFRPRVSLSS